MPALTAALTRRGEHGPTPAGAGKDTREQRVRNAPRAACTGAFPGAAPQGHPRLSSVETLKDHTPRRRSRPAPRRSPPGSRANAAAAGSRPRRPAAPRPRGERLCRGRGRDGLQSRARRCFPPRSWPPAPPRPGGSSSPVPPPFPDASR